jgi:hypothetical protein
MRKAKMDSRPRAREGEGRKGDREIREQLPDLLDMECNACAMFAAGLQLLA